MLSETRVTDAGLQSLRGLTKLRFVNLWRSKVTDEGVRELREALPNAQITR